LVTVSDKKLQHTSDNQTVDYYTADIASASDYYPGGMQMPGRTITGTSQYRYGFNGKELDPNMDGNNYDYGFRIYNPQIQRFLSTDPLQKKYAELTPYQFASNTPIWASDIDGLEARIKTIYTGADGKTHISVDNASSHSSADWKTQKQAMFGGFGGTAKGSSFAWTSGYDSYNYQYLKAGNESGYAGPEGGTLTIDARGSVIKLSFEQELGKNAPKGPQSPTVGESITMGAKGFYHIFIHGDNKAMAGSEEANNTIHNYLLGFMTAFGGEGIMAWDKSAASIISKLNAAGSLDDFLGGEKGPLSSKLDGKSKAIINSAKFTTGLLIRGLDIMELGKSVKDGYKTVKNTTIVLKDTYDVIKSGVEAGKSIDETKDKNKTNATTPNN
jgi:RHS repeat-associated protein